MAIETNPETPYALLPGNDIHAPGSPLLRIAMFAFMRRTSADIAHPVENAHLISEKGIALARICDPWCASKLLMDTDTGARHGEWFRSMPHERVPLSVWKLLSKEQREFVAPTGWPKGVQTNEIDAATRLVRTIARFVKAVARRRNSSSGRRLLLDLTFLRMRGDWVWLPDDERVSLPVWNRLHYADKELLPPHQPPEDLDSPNG